MKGNFVFYYLLCMCVILLVFFIVWVYVCVRVKFVVVSFFKWLDINCGLFGYV